MNQEIGEKPHTQYQRWKKNIGKSVEDHWEEIMRKYTWLSSMLKTSTLEQEMLNTISPSAHILRFRLNERTNKRKRKHRLFSMSTHKSHTSYIYIYVYMAAIWRAAFSFSYVANVELRRVCALTNKRKNTIVLIPVQFVATIFVREIFSRLLCCTTIVSWSEKKASILFI